MGTWIFVVVEDEGWCLIGNDPSGKPEDNEPYLICEESIGMIVDVKQPDGVAIVHQQELD